MSKRAHRLTLVLNSIIMLFFTISVFGKSVSAVNYYPDYSLSANRTDTNIEIAFLLASVGLLILAIDSLLYLVHVLWSRRPAARQARRQRWSQEQS